MTTSLYLIPSSTRRLRSTTSWTRAKPTTHTLDTHSSFTRVLALSCLAGILTFASDTSLGDHGDLNSSNVGGVGLNSDTSGYITAGENRDLDIWGTSIQKFPFASDSGASHTGDLVTDFGGQTGSSSTDSGYLSGGRVLEA